MYWVRGESGSQDTDISKQQSFQKTSIFTSEFKLFYILIEVPIYEEVETPDTVYEFLFEIPWILRKREASQDVFCFL